MREHLSWILLVLALGVAALAGLFLYDTHIANKEPAPNVIVSPVPGRNPKPSIPEEDNPPLATRIGAFFDFLHIGNRGFLMFRGNLERNMYGKGPLPENPKVMWKYPERPMCGTSSQYHVEYLWCGTGWTGQPIVWERPDGIQEVIFGAYDGAMHFVDGKTGKDLRKPFQTGDIIKGSATLDPEFPLLYFGSRDNKLRILALDRDEPEELWALDATKLGGIWNNDWDGNPVIKDDMLFEGGENGWFYAVKLHRGYDSEGKVIVDPKIIFSMPSYTDVLLAKVGNNVSIENSVVFFNNRVYFANSGGRILGLDISNIEKGIAPVVFDYWVGDDVDATIVVDDSGMLYVASELERNTERSLAIGQLVKLNPYKKDPLVWGLPIPKQYGISGGTWSTPAMQGRYLYASVNPGELWVIDKKSGEILFRERTMKHPHYALPSPVIVDDKLLLATCEGKLHNYSLQNPISPKLLWELPVGNRNECIESTPTVWNGMIWIGSRDGYFYTIGESIKSNQ